MKKSFATGGANRIFRKNRIIGKYPVSVAGFGKKQSVEALCFFSAVITARPKRDSEAGKIE